ncbi:MAG: DNA polymerase III subunit beta [Candidatus Bruticola sp.]
MHISCEKNLLKNAIDQVSKAISSKQPLPILSHILFETIDNKLKLTASSLDKGISCIIPVEEIREEGSTTCSAKVIAEIVNELPQGFINLDTDSNVNSELTVSNETSTFKVMTLPSEEFPKSIKPQNCESIKISAENFCSIINKVAIAVAGTNESRPSMQGVSISFKPEEIIFASTDGKRLSKLSIPYKNTGSKETQQIIVPGKPLNELSKILDKEQDLDIHYSKSHIFVSSENMSFFCNLLEGNFPDYEKVIPKTFKSKCQVGRESFISTIKRVMIMAKDKDIPNVIKLSFDNDSILLTSETNSMGSAEERINAVYEGEPLDIAFNGNYISDVLKVLESEEILIQLQDNKSSISIKENEEDTNFIYICMPVRTR